MSNTVVSELLNRNKAVVAKHQPIPSFADIAKMGGDKPHTMVITCVDPRCVPEYFLDLKPTDGVVAMRNVCGHVAPILNEIAALDAFITINDIMVIHHSDCGTTHFTNEFIREELKKRLPDSMSKDVDSTDYGAVSDLAQSVRDDLAILRASPLIRKELGERATGYLYDLTTGALTPVNE